MSAETLRRAASVLRARAEAHEGREWRWTGVGEHGYPQQVIALGNAALIAETYNGPDWPHPAAEWIATVDPAVGLALADWLDGISNAERHEVNGADLHHALAVARAILGGTQ
jgi:hypothetical protein